METDLCYKQIDSVDKYYAVVSEAALVVLLVYATSFCGSSGRATAVSSL